MKKTRIYIYNNIRARASLICDTDILCTVIRLRADLTIHYHTLLLFYLIIELILLFLSTNFHYKIKCKMVKIILNKINRNIKHTLEDKNLKNRH